MLMLWWRLPADFFACEAVAGDGKSRGRLCCAPFQLDSEILIWSSHVIIRVEN